MACPTLNTPPEIAESVVGWFLPPACREEVLGDLYERYVNGTRYAASAVNVAPRVIFSQVRRNTDALVFLLTACAICYSFAAGSASGSEPLAPLCVAIPAAAAILVLLLRNGFAQADLRRQRAITLDIAFAMGAAALTQLVLMQLRPDLLLPHWCPSEGAAGGWLFVIVLRALFPPEMKSVRQAPFHRSSRQLW